MQFTQKSYYLPKGFTLIARVGQALPDNPPAKGHLAAFTLIELLVVVLIICILAAVAVPQYQVAVTKSRYATMKNLVKSIADAQEVYYLANGFYATRFDKLDVDIGGTPKDENDNRRTFNWGFCNIDSNYVYCWNPNIKMEYQIALSHSTDTWANKKQCVTGSKDLNAVPNKICRQETGLEIPSFTEGNTQVWDYQ